VEEPIPRVTFAVPVRNGEAFVRRALDSALAQDFDDFEIVVSDNASDDATPEILRDYSQRDPRIRLFANSENIGVIENVNRVFHLARGEFVRLLGCDDWLEPRYRYR
jgi:glycosyltransferase involved in cell wall biosynthesis